MPGPCSRISKPSELLHAKSKSSVILEIVAVVCAVLVVGLGWYFGRKYTARLMKERSAATATAAVEEGKAAQFLNGSGVVVGRSDSRRVGVEMPPAQQARGAS